MEIKLSEIQTKNLIAFLDRVEIKGINEIQAMAEILQLLSNKEEDQAK